MAYNVSTYPKVYNVIVNDGDTYTTNVLNFPNTAVFVQIENNSAYEVNIQLNGDSAAVFQLPGNTTQVFNYRELFLNSLAFQRTISGAGTVTLQILAGILSA